MIFGCNKKNSAKMTDKSVVEWVLTSVDLFENPGVEYNSQLVVRDKAYTLRNTLMITCISLAIFLNTMQIDTVTVSIISMMLSLLVLSITLADHKLFYAFSLPAVR